jgi:hypothetical protein
MMSDNDTPARPAAAIEPGREALAHARALLAEVENRVFPGSQTAPLCAQASPIRQAVRRLFGDAR